MNDNLHKKFRRQNHLDIQYSSLHPTVEDFSYRNNNQLYHPSQLNGDYKNNINKSTIGNGQALSTGEDDDDDIVLVSDDDSEEKKINSMRIDKIKKIIHISIFILELPSLSEPTTYVPDIPVPYVETVTVKSTTTTTTLVLNDPVYAKDLFEDIDRVWCRLFHRIENINL